MVIQDGSVKNRTERIWRTTAWQFKQGSGNKLFGQIIERKK